MGTQAKMGRDGDVVAFLKGQHDEIKALFDKVASERGAGRERAFADLCRLMDMHEAGEEAVVHPTATRMLPGGEVMVAARLSEEAKARRAVAHLKTLNLESHEFETELQTLQNNVLAHATHEEREELDKLSSTLDRDRLLRMRKAVELCESASQAPSSSARDIYDKAAARWEDVRKH